MKSAVREALVAAGVSDAQLAALEEKYPARRRVSINTETCPGCGSKPSRGDYACGSCSAVKVQYDRRFWQHAADLEAGFTGRPLAKKPVEQKLPRQGERSKPVASTLPLQIPVVEIPMPHRHEFLVTVGLEGRVVAAPNAIRAIEIVHASRGDEKTVGHSVLKLGITFEPETEIETPEKPTVPAIEEHVYKIDGPGFVEVWLRGRVVKPTKKD